MSSIVTVRCGHCANLLSVNTGALLQTTTYHQKQLSSNDDKAQYGGSGSSSFQSVEPQGPRIPAICPPEKRQRLPSAYNRFIKEEIKRIKALNPEISHREAFSTAAKNMKELESKKLYNTDTTVDTTVIKLCVAESSTSNPKFVENVWNPTVAVMPLRSCLSENYTELLPSYKWVNDDESWVSVYESSV
ncbi:hypothetical protein L6452_09016 [Arctium lappa]|uniref:Uncharacterized protein n=1 Tax=Arctium lappa TaxID=4217 RepID=A0ACB9DJB8_ARCLA|nr:hypothetical protein L6452_09016 [Arctium lappa]